MKRILYIFFACAFSMGMYAQETVVTSDNTDKTDSLAQVVIFYFLPKYRK